MTLLIALALFYCVVAGILNTKDRRELAATKRRIQRSNATEGFLENVYVTAWYYYQPLEQQVAEAWIEAHSDYTVNDFAPTTQEYRIVGQQLLDCDIQQVAVGQAIGYLRQIGETVCSRNHAYSSTDHNEGWERSAIRYQEDAERTAQDIIKELPDLTQPYQWPFTYRITNPQIKSLIPQRDDLRTTMYWRPHYDNQKWSLRQEPR